MHRAVFGLLVSAFFVAGCAPQATTSRTPPSDTGRGGVHIRAPGVEVDVERKPGTQRGVDVDVDANNRRDR